MGAFDLVFVSEVCDDCERSIRRGVQFKIGAPRQREYEVGASVAPLSQTQASADLLVEGLPMECPECAAGPAVLYRAIWLVNGIIRGVRPWRTWELYADEMNARRDGTYAARPKSLPFDEVV
jgi:hypothetical protein